MTRYVLFDPFEKTFVSRFNYNIAWNDSNAILEKCNKLQRAAKFSDAHTAVFMCEIINALNDGTFVVVNENENSMLFCSLYGNPEDYREEMQSYVLAQYPNAHFIDACGSINERRLFMRFKREKKSSAIYACVREENGELKIVGGSPF